MNDVSYSIALHKIFRIYCITLIFRNASLKLTDGCCFLENFKFTYQKKQLFYKKKYIRISLNVHNIFKFIRKCNYKSID